MTDLRLSWSITLCCAITDWTYIQYGVESLDDVIPKQIYYRIVHSPLKMLSVFSFSAFSLCRWLVRTEHTIEGTAFVSTYLPLPCWVVADTDFVWRPRSSTRAGFWGPSSAPVELNVQQDLATSGPEVQLNLALTFQRLRQTNFLQVHFRNIEKKRER